MKNIDLWAKKTLLNDKRLEDIKVFKINYAISRNKRGLQSEIELIQAELAKIDKSQQFFAEEQSLKAEYLDSLSDETKKEEYIKKINEFEEKYADQRKMTNDILLADSAYEFYKIKISDFPDLLDIDIVNLLYDIIQE